MTAGAFLATCGFHIVGRIWICHIGLPKKTGSLMRFAIYLVDCAVEKSKKKLAKQTPGVQELELCCFQVSIRIASPRFLRLARSRCDPH